MTVEKGVPAVKHTSRQKAALSYEEQISQLMVLVLF